MDFWTSPSWLGHNVTINPELWEICNAAPLAGVVLIVNRILCHGISQ
jgi:hypothetical protein